MAGKQVAETKVEVVEPEVTTKDVKQNTEKVDETAVSEETKKQYTVKSPDPNFCGVGAAGIQFANGQGIINDNGDDGDKTAWVIEWYKSHGYKVE